MPVFVDCGDDEFIGAAEHPAVRRLRHRRLLTFLCLQGMEGTFGSMVHETDAYFSVAHLQDFMEQGLWRDAIAYLSRFLHLDNNRPLSLEAQVLHHFLLAHKGLEDILADTNEGRALASRVNNYRRSYDKKKKTVCDRSIMVKLISLNWDRVRHRAAKIAYRLVHRTPELKGLALLSSGSMEPHNILPICTRSGQRCRSKNNPCRPQASTLAKCYMRRRGRLLSSSPSKESANELHAKATDWIADILDECVKAGQPLERHHQKHPLQTSGKQDEYLKAGQTLERLHQKHPLQTSGKQGACSKLISESMFSTLIEHAGNSVSPSVIDADASSKTVFGSFAGPAKNLGSTAVENAGKVACHVPTPGAPCLGTMLNHREKSGTALTADTSESSKAGEPPKLHQERLLQTSGKHGALSNPISQGMFGTLTYARNSVAAAVRRAGATSAPVSQAMLGTMAVRARNPDMPSVANAGELARCVLSPGDPFLKKINADECLKAGQTLERLHQKHPLQTSGKQGAHSNLISQNMFGTMIEHAGNSVASSVREAGTSMHRSQEGCHAESAHMGFGPRKKPREKPTTDEQDLHPKRRHKTGTTEKQACDWKP